MNAATAIVNTSGTAAKRVHIPTANMIANTVSLAIAPNALTVEFTITEENPPTNPDQSFNAAFSFPSPCPKNIMHPNPTRNTSSARERA